MSTNHIFCFSCGNKLLYNLAKPNFCGKCGSNLGSTAVAKIPSQKSRASRPSDEDDFEDEDNLDIDYIPDIKEIAVEIESFEGNSTFSLGSLFGDNSHSAFKARRKTSVDDFIDEKKS